MFFTKVSSEIRIIRVDVLSSICLTNLTNEMVSPAVYEEFLLVKISTFTEIANWMIFPSVRDEMRPRIKVSLAGEDVGVPKTELTVVEVVFSPHVSVQLGKCLERCFVRVPNS